LAQNRQVSSYGIMSAETLARVLARAVEALPSGQNQLSLIFQGGEPMLAGIDFYRHMEQQIDRMKAPNIRFQRSIQTNGTLINDEWAEFFARYGYLVGVSLDGPADIQNALRPMANGKGSFGSVSSGIACLHRRKVESNVLCVVSAEVARHGTKVYRFLRKNQWDYIQFIPCMDSLNGERSSWHLSPELYGRFLTQVFGEYERERMQGRFVSVRWFDNLVDMAAGHRPESCGMVGQCACHFVLEADGSVYPCDFYVDDAHRLGNVADKGFREMFESDAVRGFVEESLQPAAQCAHCKWFFLCRGGCRRYRPMHEGKLGVNALCAAYQVFFEECGARIVRMARQMQMWEGRM
ncbi:MAG: SPASM domain-containing protein, partial [Clostridia bacterium]|nr:SPASM domain-containing protein [Clostridia bacterium]